MNTTSNAGEKRGGMTRRWAFMKPFQVVQDGKPHLSRLRIIQTPWAALYLHRIHEPDQQRDPHDHPWPFWSLILAGSYTERIHDTPGSSRDAERGTWSLHYMPVSAAHRITEVRDMPWTLALTGPRVRDWGFWTPGGFVGWRDYGNGDEGP